MNSILYPATWSFGDTAGDRLSLNALIPAGVPPSGSTADCANCSGYGTVFAKQVTDRISLPLVRLGGHRYHLSIVAAACPVCQGGALKQWLLVNSGLDGLVLEGKPMADIRVAEVPPAFGQGDAFAAAWQILSELPAPKTWALFSGRFGTGKTHILAGIVNGSRLAGVHARYAHSASILDEIRETFDDRAARTTAEVVTEYVRVPLLAVDEVDRIRWSEWAETQLFHLLEARYQAGRSTVFASNLGPIELEELGSTAAAIVSRISSGLVVALTGGDLRPQGGVPDAQVNGLPERFTQ